MTREEIQAILDNRSATYSGKIDSEGFGIDSGPFENSDCSFVAYLRENYSGDFYFDTLDELLDGFMINGNPFGNQLSNITFFHAVLCND